MHIRTVVVMKLFTAAGRSGNHTGSLPVKLMKGPSMLFSSYHITDSMLQEPCKSP